MLLRMDVVQQHAQHEQRDVTCRGCIVEGGPVTLPHSKLL